MKTCQMEGCTSRVWSGGKCRLHAPKAPIKRGFLKRKPSSPAPQKREDGERMFKEMAFWYNTRPERRCEQCGERLPLQFSTVYVHHLLPKAKYKDVKFDSSYWMMLCVDCHSTWEQSFKGDVIRLRTEEALDRYTQTNLNQ